MLPLDVFSELNIVDNLIQLESLWNEVGLSEEQMTKRLRRLIDHLNNRVTDIVNDEATSKKTFELEITSQKQKADVICAKLCLEPLILGEGLTLMEKSSLVSTYYNDMTKSKERQMAQLTAIQKRLDSNSKLLNEPSPGFDPSDFTPAAIRQLECVLRDQEARVKRKMSDFSNLQAELTSVSQQLPDLSVPSEYDTTPSVLSRSFFVRMTNFLETSRNELNSRRRKLQSLVARANMLNDNLKLIEAGVSLPVDSEVITNVNISQWTKKISEMEGLMAHQKESIVKSLREDTDKFYGGTRDLSLTVEDDVDVIMERYVRVMDMNATVSALDTIVEKWKTALGEIELIESRSGDPDRLKNRGGVLLKDANNLQRLNRELTRLEGKVESFPVGGGELGQQVSRRKAEFMEMVRFERERVEGDRKKSVLNVSKPVRPTTSKSFGFTSTPLRVSNSTLRKNTQRK